MEVYVYVVRNVVVFESVDVGLKYLKRQTDLQTDLQTDRQNIFRYTKTNTKVKTLFVDSLILVMPIITKDDRTPRASLICVH
jgi:argonaute-like protein implicated in RNA metabolism and viral defense